MIDLIVLIIVVLLFTIGLYFLIFNNDNEKELYQIEQEINKNDEIDEEII